MAYLVSKWRENCVLSAHSSFGAFGLTPGPLGGSFQQALTQFQASLKTTRSQTPYLWTLIVPLQSAHQPGVYWTFSTCSWGIHVNNSDLFMHLEALAAYQWANGNNTEFLTKAIEEGLSNIFSLSHLHTSFDTPWDRFINYYFFLWFVAFLFFFTLYVNWFCVFVPNVRFFVCFSFLLSYPKFYHRASIFISGAGACS